MKRLLVIMVAIALARPAAGADRPPLDYQRASIRLGDGWSFDISSNGRARVTWSAMDSIWVPVGTFDWEKCRADINAAIAAAPPTPDEKLEPERYWAALKDAEIIISVAEPEVLFTTGYSAKFTPEIGAYVNRVLASRYPQGGPAYVKYVVSEAFGFEARRFHDYEKKHPIFSRNQMAARGRWPMGYRGWIIAGLLTCGTYLAYRVFRSRLAA